jgi:hypothetical protein
VERVRDEATLLVRRLMEKPMSMDDLPKHEDLDSLMKMMRDHGATELVIPGYATIRLGGAPEKVLYPLNNPRKAAKKSESWDADNQGDL